MITSFKVDGQMMSEKKRKRTAIAAALVVYLLASVCIRGESQATLEAIKRAGNAESELERYHLLVDLAKRPDLSSELEDDLKRLLPVVDWWANGRRKYEEVVESGRAAEDGYLNDFFYPEGRLDRGARFPPGIDIDSELYPLWAFYKARTLISIPIQDGGISPHPEKREQYYEPSRRLLRIAQNAYPENALIGMYLGKPTEWRNSFEPDPKAPEWANLQREGLEKLLDLIHWWIEHRQLADGQYGGGWGDDVEMWRWWVPILVGFRDPVVESAQRLLSTSIFAQPHLEKGYTNRFSDVEHTAEDTADTITPMLFLSREEQIWRTRALRIADLSRQKWMGINQRGFLQFKSTWFNVDRLDHGSDRACDTVYHPRVLQPALVHWLRTGDSELGKLVPRWMDTWVDAAGREENGKPAGVVPSAIHWPDGQIGGGVDPWWKPRNYESNLYHWPSAMSLMTSTMLLTYHMTGDGKYLQPIHSMAKIRRKYLNDPVENPIPGSEAWCALVGKHGKGMRTFLPAALAQYRLLTGDGRYDDLLEADANGYVRMRMGQGREALVEDLKENARAFRMNREAYTSEVRWTDRVLAFNERFGNEGNGWNWPVPDTALLYATITGDPGVDLYFPMNAVRWLIEPRDFAALVVDSGRSRFEAELYSFSSEKRVLPAELYLLEKGRYTLTILAGNQVLQKEDLTVGEGPATVSFQFPSRTLCRLLIARDS